MPDFGFVGAAYQAPSIYQDAQECINWYPEVDQTKPPGSRGVVALYPTPGLVTKATLAAAAEVRGMYVLPGGTTMFAVSGSVLYLVDASFSATAVGNLATSSGPVSISDNGVSAYIVDGANRYSCTIGGGLFQQISASDGAFTGGGRVDEIDSFFIYNQPNTNQWAASSPLSTATPGLSVSSKDSAADNIVTLIADHRQVILLGEKTTEQWINAGTFPFPFQKIPGTLIQHGCAAKNTVTRLGEGIAWLASDTRGQSVVVSMAGGQLRRLSTHAVENDIGTVNISDAIAFTYQRRGHEFLMLTFPSQDKTWVYDLATELWHKRAWRDNLNVLHRHRANCYASFHGLNLVGDWENGKIYALADDVYDDDGQAILRMRRCLHLTSELKRVYHTSLQIQFQPGVGLATGQGSDPQMMLRWSNDGGSTWSSYWPISIGQAGAYKNRAIRRKLGYARDRIYEVTITDPVNAVIVSANLETEVGDN